MIDLAFGDSAAGALKYAKSMKPGQKMQGVIAVIGGQSGQPGKPRNSKTNSAWQGTQLKGSPQDVVPLTLAIDIGPLDTLFEDMTREAVLRTLFTGYPHDNEVLQNLTRTNKITLQKLDEAKETCEPVRVWVCPDNPSEQCGLLFLCWYMRGQKTPLSAVRLPRWIERENTITQFRGTGEISPELFGSFERYETPITELERCMFSSQFNDLIEENAPLRGIINGQIISLPEDFYDFMLRTHLPEGDFVVAAVIGRALSLMPGVGDQWLFRRINALCGAGVLKEVSPARVDHPYSAVMRRA